MAQTFVKSFMHLTHMPKADRALSLLQRVASLVKPIMRKRGWVLPTLSEFFPDTPNLLDVNGGEQILLRLRPAWAPDTFLEEDAVIRTMLHELTHNVHGPHDEKFYKFLAELEDEYDALQRSGYAGEGFFTPGYRLGAGVSHDLPPYLARVQALEAAENRRRAEALTKSGGRLGGRSSALERLSPRELAARAAERRKQDEIICGSASGNAFGSSWSQPTSGSSWTRDALNPGPPTNEQWICPVCTLVNPELVLQCNACLTVRPIDTPVGWTCATCTETDIPHELSSCRFCGAAKTHS